MLCAKFTVSRNVFANFDPRKIREYEHNRLQVNVLKYIFFLESLASVKMFDTELQVYINRCFVFFIEIGYANVFELQRGRCAHCFFIYCKICICLIPNSFHIYCANFFFTSVVHSGLEIFYMFKNSVRHYVKSTAIYDKCHAVNFICLTRMFNISSAIRFKGDQGNKL